VQQVEPSLEVHYVDDGILSGDMRVAVNVRGHQWVDIAVAHWNKLAGECYLSVFEHHGPFTVRRSQPGPNWNYRLSGEEGA
jgi:hypothetical protein